MKIKKKKKKESNLAFSSKRNTLHQRTLTSVCSLKEHSSTMDEGYPDL